MTSKTRLESIGTTTDATKNSASFARRTTKTFTCPKTPGRHTADAKRVGTNSAADATDPLAILMPTTVTPENSPSTTPIFTAMVPIPFPNYEKFFQKIVVVWRGATLAVLPNWFYQFYATSLMHLVRDRVWIGGITTSDQGDYVSNLRNNKVPCRSFVSLDR